MKTCSKCKTAKPIDEFGKNKSKKDGLQVQCSVCRKQTNAEYYKKTPEKNPQRKAARDRQRLINLEWIHEYLKTHPCVDCKEDDWIVLEFDHVRGKKLLAVTRMAHSAVSLDKVKAEVAKCEVRCANCHRRVTYNRLPNCKKAQAPLTQLVE